MWTQLQWTTLHVYGHTLSYSACVCGHTYSELLCMYVWTHLQWATLHVCGHSYSELLCMCVDTVTVSYSACVWTHLQCAKLLVMYMWTQLQWTTVHLLVKQGHFWTVFCLYSYTRAQFYEWCHSTFTPDLIWNASANQTFPLYESVAGFACNDWAIDKKGMK
jgi:hypothetical protein